MEVYSFLTYVSENNAVEVYKILDEWSIPMEDYNQAIIEASAKGHIDILNKLLENPLAEIHHKSLTWAAENGQYPS
jgi:hypothetical protein